MFTKATLFISAFFLSLSAMAAEVQWIQVMGDVGTTTSKTTNRDSTGMSAAFLVGLDNGYVIEFRNRTQQADKVGNEVGANNYGAPVGVQEIGVSKAFNVGVTKVYGLGMVGLQETTAKRYPFHAFEAGVTDKIGNTPFSYRLGYRFIDAFTNQEYNKGKNEQLRATVSYSLTKNHQVSVRYQDQRGDAPHSGYFLGYGYRF